MGTISYVPAQTAGTYQEGTAAYGMCNVGYSLQGTSSTLCQNGAWLYELGTCNATVPAPELSHCSPVVVLNADLTYENDTAGNVFYKADGTKITFKCHRGFETDGNTQATCTKGVWTQGLGTCKLKICSTASSIPATCDALAPPAGSTLSYSNNAVGGPYPSGTLAIMNCSSGSPLGPAASSCTNGTWIPEALGTCSSTTDPTTNTNKKGCSVEVAFNGHITYSDNNVLNFEKPEGTMANLTCFFNMVAEGPTSSHCQNGTWTPPLGACFGRCP